MQGLPPTFRQATRMPHSPCTALQTTGKLMSNTLCRDYVPEGHTGSLHCPVVLHGTMDSSDVLYLLIGGAGAEHTATCTRLPLPLCPSPSLQWYPSQRCGTRGDADGRAGAGASA